jgi:hypothetical protein
MKIKYKITSDSRITIDNKEIFCDKVSQLWELTLERELGTYNFFLTVEITQYPKSNSWEVQPMYELLNIVIKPSSLVCITIDGDGQFKSLNNKKEILASWVKCKKEITDKFGNDENILRMVNNLENSFYSYSEEIDTSLYYFILLSQWQNKKKRSLKTRSLLHEGDSVNVDITCKDKIKTPENKTSWVHTGSGEINHLSKFKKLYDQQLKQYAHAEFDYKYAFHSEYLIGKKRETFNLFEKTITHVEEQASEGYKYYNTIEFNLMEEK